MTRGAHVAVKAVTRRFGVSGTPTIVVIGSDGVARYHGHEPPSSWVAR